MPLARSEARLIYARKRDATIYFDIDGMGLVPGGPRMRERPVAFLIHGGPGSDHLTRAMQLVHCDHRGHGRSARDDDPARWTIDENGEDMEALRRHPGIGGIVSIGASYGGMVGMAQAARYPDAVPHLILSRDGRAWPVHPPRSRDPRRARHGRAAGDRRLALGRRVQERGGRAALPHRDGPALLAPLRPTLIIAGKHDWLCPPEFSEESHGLIPGSRYELSENSSHLIRADEPERLMAAIVGFVGARTAD